MVKEPRMIPVQHEYPATQNYQQWRPHDPRQMPQPQILRPSSNNSFGYPRQELHPSGFPAAHSHNPPQPSYTPRPVQVGIPDPVAIPVQHVSFRDSLPFTSFFETPPRQMSRVKADSSGQRAPTRGGEGKATSTILSDGSVSEHQQSRSEASDADIAGREQLGDGISLGTTGVDQRSERGSEVTPANEAAAAEPDQQNNDNDDFPAESKTDLSNFGQTDDGNAVQSQGKKHGSKETVKSARTAINEVKLVVCCV